MHVYIHMHAYSHGYVSVCVCIYVYGRLLFVCLDESRHFPSSTPPSPPLLRPCHLLHYNTIVGWVIFVLMQRTVILCNSLQRTADHCSTLQHTATHCNTCVCTEATPHEKAHNKTVQHIATQCVAMCCTVATHYISLMCFFVCVCICVRRYTQWPRCERKTLPPKLALLSSAGDMCVYVFVFVCMCVCVYMCLCL